jgi:endonuclease YncB( thermonuclease family)
MRAADLFVMIVLAGGGAGCQERDAGLPSTGKPAGGAAGACGFESNEALVVRTSDGDTLVLESGDRVRLIGVDTPETHHPELPVQRFGKEASDFTRKHAEGRRVQLEFGPECRDKYGRLLAYVWVDGQLLNRSLVRRGYGYAMTRFPHPKMEDFVLAEREARERHYGLWHDSPSDGRLANLMSRWDALSPEGHKRLEEYWDGLLKSHPAAAR